MAQQAQEVGSNGVASRGALRRIAPRSVAGFLIVVFMLVVGGGSAASATNRLLAELAGLPPLLYALHRSDYRQLAREDGLAAAILVSVVALMIAQLVPLAPSIWTNLPGRTLVTAGDTLLFDAPTWRPLSLDPDATVRAALMLVPAIGVYLLARTATADGQVRLTLCFAVFASLTLLLGLLQFTTGEQLATHFYSNSHNAFPVGVFANRNHQAILLVCAIPLCAGLLSRYEIGTKLGARLALSSGTAGMLAFAAVALTLAAGVLITGSRTAAALLLPALACSFALGAQRDWTKKALAFSAVALVLILGVATAIVVASDGPLGSAAMRSFGGDDRFNFWPQVAAVVRVYLPWGSGVGTFRSVYDAAEPLQLIGPLYLNHAHCDWLEVPLETGFPGMILIAIFLFWFFGRTVSLWRGAVREEILALPLAATVIVGLLLLHSAVDYPLRTVTNSCLFTLSLALMRPAKSQRRSRREGLIG